jgi:hypothetical protein
MFADVAGTRIVNERGCESGMRKIPGSVARGVYDDLLHQLEQWRKVLPYLQIGTRLNTMGGRVPITYKTPSNSAVTCVSVDVSPQIFKTKAEPVRAMSL